MTPVTLIAAARRYKKDAMCLAIPGRVEQICEEAGLRMGRVNFGGVVKRICLDYAPEVQVGDYTIVHAGFAISRIDEETAQKTLAEFHAMGLSGDTLAEQSTSERRDPVEF